MHELRLALRFILRFTVCIVLRIVQHVCVGRRSCHGNLRKPGLLSDSAANWRHVRGALNSDAAFRGAVNRGAFD